ncbi:MAG: substrate-binding domain-containing protein [Bacteroidota bacterium]|jgi:ribose transport system substrate-binding protein
MKTTCFHLLSVVIIILGLQSLVFPQEKLKIAVIPINNTSLFWKSVHVGVKLEAMSAGGVEFVWNAPLTENNKEQQITIVERCITEGISGIVLAPVNAEALTNSVSKAMKKRIPVLILDSGLKGTLGKDFISFVGIENKKAGDLAGEHLARLLEGKGKIVLLRNVEGQANTTEREEGFLEAIAKHPEIKVVVKNRYAGGNVDMAKKVSMNILSQFNEIDGIFCPNESSTIGMLLALREANLAGKVKFIGFDTPAPVVEALRKGEMDALIVQNPVLMGFLSVKTLVDKIRGKKISITMDAGIHLIKRENLDDADVKKLLTLPSIVEKGL